MALASESVAPTGADRFSENVSSASGTVSPEMLTATVLDVCPAANATVVAASAV